MRSGPKAAEAAEDKTTQGCRCRSVTNSPQTGRLRSGMERIMNETDIRSYAVLMQEFGLTGLEIAEDNRTVRLERSIAAAPLGERPVPPASPAWGGQPAPAVPKPEGSPADAGTEHAGQPSLSVTSPMVGVFYAAPAENADPYVAVGDRVRRGQTLCMVEAMKLMNEITAEEDGVVDQILVANGQVVEYGTELFRLKRD